jgi:hypothetical protein
VYAFNRFQERQFRRRMESRFQERPAADVLLDPAPAAAPERIEPHVGEPPPQPVTEERAAATDTPAEDAAPVAPRPHPVPQATTDAPLEPTEPGLSPIDYVCDIETADPIPPAVLNEFVKAVTAIGKPVSVIGWHARVNQWIALPCPPEVSLSRIQASLQLADRAGAVNRVQLSSMRDLVQQFAERIGGVCECPQIDRAAQIATEIDRFCAEVDISLGCNIVPNASGGLPGTKLRGLLESAGFQLESSGRFILRAEDGTVLLVAGSIDDDPLSVERLRAAPVPGLSLVLDVPRVPAASRAFERMLEVSHQLAKALDATVVDDNRARLTEAGVKVIRQQLRNVHAAMEAHGIPAGGALASRLFS